MIPLRIYTERERRLIVDAIRRSAAEARATRASAELPSVLDSVAGRAHYELLVAREADLDQIASEMDDSRMELRLEKRLAPRRKR